jgi:hypothetical protein
LVISYGPHKIAKILHQAFTQPLSTTISASGKDILHHEKHAIPNSLSGGAASQISPPAGSDVPLTTQSISPKPLEIVKSNATIDTSITQPGGMRVLLVEDNEVNMKLLVAYMRKLKLSHSTAINGLEALNMYKEAKGDFDAIFMG